VNVGRLVPPRSQLQRDRRLNFGGLPTSWRGAAGGSTATAAESSAKSPSRKTCSDRGLPLPSRHAPCIGLPPVARRFGVRNSLRPAAASRFTYAPLRAGEMQVLIADGDGVFLKQARHMLLMRGHESTLAGDGLECVRVLGAFVPDLVVLSRELLWGG